MSAAPSGSELPLLSEETWRRRLELAAHAVTRARTTDEQTEAITQLEHELRALERQKVEHRRELADPRRVDDEREELPADVRTQPVITVRLPRPVERHKWEVRCEAHRWGSAGRPESYTLLVIAPDGERGWRVTVRRTSPLVVDKALLEAAKRQAELRVRELFEEVS